MNKINKKNKILVNILNVSFFNIIGAFLGFLLNIFLARYYDIDDYGKINLFITTFLVIYTIFEFGFSNTLVILKASAEVPDKKNVNNYINKQYLKYSTILLIAFLIISFFIKNKLGDFFNPFIIILIASYLFSLSRYAIAKLQADERWKIYNILNILNNGLKFIIILSSIAIAEYYFNRKLSLTYYYYAFLLYVIILLIITVYKVGFGIKSNINIEEFKSKLIKTLIPLGLTNILIIIAMRIDVYLIKWLLDEYYLGIYSAANSLALIFPLVTSSIMRVLIPESTKSGSAFLKKILNVQKKYFIYLIIAILLTIISSQYFIPIILGEKYVASIRIFQVFSIIYLGGMFFTPLESYFFANKQVAILKIRSIQIIIITVLGFIFIKQFGIIGMPIAIVVSRLFAWIYFTIKSYKIIK